MFSTRLMIIGSPFIGLSDSLLLKQENFLYQPFRISSFLESARGGTFFLGGDFSYGEDIALHPGLDALKGGRAASP